MTYQVFNYIFSDINYNYTVLKLKILIALLTASFIPIGEERVANK